MQTLFSPLTIRGRTFQNRITAAAMLVCDVSLRDGQVNEEYRKHYRWLCRRGVGAIVSGALAVTPGGIMTPGQLAIWDDRFVDGLAQLCGICRQADVRHIALLNHAGFRSAVEIPVGPSAHQEGENPPTRAMTPEELKRLQQAYIDAAVRAQKAGFDGIQLQCAHLYLIDEFFSSVHNHRTDAYGGSIENRARFAVEILQAVRRLCGEDFLLSVRMGCNSPTLEDSLAIARLLIQAGLDSIDVSWSTLNLPLITAENLPKPEDFPFSGLVYGAARMKEKLDVPIGAVWQIPSESAGQVVERGYADFVDVLRGLLVDPDWVENARRGLPSRPCHNCKPVCRWFKSRTLCPGWSALPPSTRLEL